MLPNSFPPPSTVYRWFARFRDDGTWETINHHLLMRDRERVGREVSPAAGIMDARASKPQRRAARADTMRERRCSAASVTPSPTRTGGRALQLHAHPASVQDRDGAGPLLKASRPRCPFIERVFVDSGYAGPRVAKAVRTTVEIVRKQAGQVGFAVQPRGGWSSGFRMAWPELPTGKGLQGNRRVCQSLPLRRFRYAAALKSGTLPIRFGVNSK
jgi:putative transposase